MIYFLFSEHIVIGQVLVHAVNYQNVNLYRHVDVNLWRFVQLDVVKYERFKIKVLVLKLETIGIDYPGLRRRSMMGFQLFSMHPCI